MNTKDLVKAVAEQTGLTKTDVAKVIEATKQTITESLANGNEVFLSKLGTFKVKKRQFKGFDFKTKEKRTFDVANVSFTPSTTLKEAIK
jgi:DNA-binding protein HU-beta